MGDAALSPSPSLNPNPKILGQDLMFSDKVGSFIMYSRYQIHALFNSTSQSSLLIHRKPNRFLDLRIGAHSFQLPASPQPRPQDAQDAEQEKQGTSGRGIVQAKDDDPADFGIYRLLM